MSRLISCGVFIWRMKKDRRQFLLMKHPARWDFAKGHVDPGESEMECALRELEEETGISADDIEIDARFRFQTEYEVNNRRTGGEDWSKTLVVFLAELKTKVSIMPTEHESYEWFDWNPPHEIQQRAIDPLLEEIANHWNGSA